MVALATGITAGRTDADATTTAEHADSKQTGIKIMQLLLTNSGEQRKILSMLQALET